MENMYRTYGLQLKKLIKILLSACRFTYYLHIDKCENVNKINGEILKKLLDIEETLIESG